MVDEAVLEVAVTGERDVPGAQEGGASRLYLTAPGPTCSLSPEPATVAVLRRETDLPIRVNLRLNDTWTTTGGELTRLIGLAEDYLARGAEGVQFGFLDADLEIDVEVCGHIATSLNGVPWTFSRAIDDTLDPARSWRRLLRLPGLDAVRSAGSPRGMQTGFDDLVALARADATIASRLMPGGGLAPEHVPWLVRAGVRSFHLGPQARPGGSAKAYVDAGHVRSWRLLLDDALARAVG